jgi:hypothetical protein
MKISTTFVWALLCLCLSLHTSAQNFSGLQYKKLMPADNLSSLLESGLGALIGGKLTGNIDSVIVLEDAEKKLKVKVFYTGLQNAYFNLSIMNEKEQKQEEITTAKFLQTSKASPAECQFMLTDKVVKGTKIESPYLKIGVSKKENGIGPVAVFYLNKKWKNELDPENVIINVSLQPIGKAGALSNTEIKDVIPVKHIKFDPKIMYFEKATVIRPRADLRIRSGGGNAFTKKINYTLPASFTMPIVNDNISGTWINTDANTNGITKLIITNNNTIQGFGKCSPTDCDWGNTTLTDNGNNRFTAIYTFSFKTIRLDIVYANNEIAVTDSDIYNDGRAARTSTYTFKKNIQLIAATSRIYTLSEFKMVAPTTTATDLSPKGPDYNVRINLFEVVNTDVNFESPQEISNININVFADKNVSSGIYYILPADYHLRWETTTEPEKGYNFKILYGANKTEGSTETPTDATVRMSATLTAGISSREREFVKSLLKAVRPDFKELHFLPLREKPEFTFKSTLGEQYNIPQSKITVLTSTDLNADIQVAWQTDADTKEFILEALTSREGIAASVILKPNDEGIVDQQIPAIINLADIRTIGKLNLVPAVWRTQNFRNKSAYPLKLKYLHVLKKEINGTKPIVYSWAINDVVIPSLGQAAIEHTKIPTWLDNDPSVVMWIDYSVENCKNCDQKILDAVTGGVSGSKAQKLKFTIPAQVFDTLKVNYFMITVRGTQVDPNGNAVKELPSFKITKEADKEFSAGPLYPPTNGGLDFEYKITAATTDGEFYETNQWVKATEKDILLSKTKMKTLFKGIIPGIK